MIIDGTHYLENTQPLAAYPTLTGPAETAATQNDVVTLPGPSHGGRFSSAYPLWDGTGRILVTRTQCRLLSTSGALKPCSDTSAARANVKTAPPIYSLWIYDPGQGSFLPITPPTEGVMVRDVAAAEPRSPGVSPSLTDTGVIDIKSVYDVDGVNTAPGGIAAVADGKTPASARPARFLPLLKAVSIAEPDLVDLSAAACGASNDMREIMGHVPIQPDGSVQVPANVAFEVPVLDANAPLLSRQDTWLQVIPGETLTCNGCHIPAANQQVPACQGTTLLCHSHGRTGAFNAVYAGAAGGAPFADSVSTLARATCVAGSVCGEIPSIDVSHSDIWDLPRTSASGANGTCSQGGCHHSKNAAGTAAQPAGELDLTSTPGGHVPQDFVSYIDLLYAQQIPGPNDANGNPTTLAVGPLLDADNSSGMSSSKSLAIFAPGSGDTIHAGLLTTAELRLISEWLDIGAQYFNNPFDPAVPLN